MTRQIRIEKQDGSSFTLPLVTADLHRYDVYARRPDQARVTTDTPSAQNETLDKHQDELYVDDNGTDVFGGYLTDIKRGDDRTTLLANDFEADGADAERVTTEYTGADDSTIVSDAISNMPNLSAGTVNTVASSLSFVFKRASPAHIVRTVARTSGAAVSYNADKTVDYGHSPGSSRSTTVTRDAAAGSATAVEQFRVVEVGGGRATHITMLGASRGTPQREATIVPSDDNNSYTNKATYSSTWSSGDRKLWTTYTNKDQTDVTTLQEEGKQLAQELDEQHIEVETNLTVSDVVLGDTFPVEDDRQDIDQDLAVVELTREIRPDRDLFDVTLSNRQRSREPPDEKQAGDLDRYNTAFEGDVVYFTSGRDRKPVDGSTNYIVPVRFPDNVIEEVTLELQIKGLPYRAYAEPAGHTHDVDVTHPSHSHDVDVTHPSHSHDVSTTSTDNAEFASVGSESQGLAFDTINDTSWTSEHSITPSSDTSFVYAQSHIKITSSGQSGTVKARLHNTSTGNTYGEQLFNLGATDVSDTVVPGNIMSFLDPTNCNGETLQVEYQTTSASLNVGIADYYAAVGQHTHDVSDTSTTELGTTNTETSNTALGTTSTETSTSESTFEPGLADYDGSDKSPAHYPENVDVIINGTSQGTSFGNGTGEFTATLDISGTLNAGQFNTIELTSDGIGHLDAEVAGLVYLQQT